MGPLQGVRVIELAGLGPGPHAAMLLADLGAEVIRVERPVAGPIAARGPLVRSRVIVTADLKDPRQLEEVVGLIDRADVLLEGFRPGVTERLGLGPEACRARNPELVYTRLTGWGQDGPMSGLAGHDLNYVSLTGALAAMGEPGRPPPVPLNVIGDYGGGSMLAVLGVLSALFERSHSGQGQTIDAAMIDGASLLMQVVWSLRGEGRWVDRRGSNLLDGGTPYYATYACADGRYVAVAAIEPKFYNELLQGLELDPERTPSRDDVEQWPELRRRLTEVFATRTRDEWAACFALSDACVSPVVELDEVASHPQIQARGTIVEKGGVVQAAPAPRFSRTPAAHPELPKNASMAEVVARWDENRTDVG